MNAIQVLNLFLNPFAGRASRQQFLFFVLIFLTVLLWLEVWLNAYSYDKSYNGLRLTLALCGFYFVIVGWLRRLRDNGVGLLEFFQIVLPVILKCAGVFLLIVMVPLFLYLYIRFDHNLSFLFIVTSAVMTKFNCVVFSSCPQGMVPDLVSLRLFTLFKVLFGFIFFLVPLFLSNNRMPNKYGAPPVGLNLRTMLAATYPLNLKQDEQQTVNEDMSLQFFNPWIGRMNRQQFLVGTAICVIAMFLSTHFIPEPAVGIILNIFMGFIVIVFVFRRLNDQHDQDGSVIWRRLDQIKRPFRYLFFLKWFAGLYSLGFFYLMIMTIFLPPVLYFVFFFFVGPIYLFFREFSTHLSVLFVAFVSWLLLGPSYYKINTYGLPPIGMDWRTMIPATYPAHLLDAAKAEGGAA